MGSDRKHDSNARGDELPQHSVDLPGYWIGRYPVTVAQFSAFVEAGGHHPHDSDSLTGPEDHPVVYVTWHEALAYCRWLREMLGLPVTLPSEAEWEKAARGVDGRIYPWGYDQPDEDRCNFARNVGARTAVGSYSPQGDSPYGCTDMAGNVWEWTRSIYRSYPYDPEGCENLDHTQDVSRVLRGGSLFDTLRVVRSAYRNRYDPSIRFRGYGFRIVVVPVSSDSSGLAQDKLRLL